MTQIPQSAFFHYQMTSVQDTLQFGVSLARYFMGGEVLALSGELGSGKTVLTRGIALGLGVPSEHVSSPTFTLIQEYSGTLPLIHADLYRLDKPSELSALGIQEYFTPRTIVIIEWAERFPHILPADHLTVRLQYGETEFLRLLDISGTGPQSRRLVDKIRTTWKSRTE